MGSLLELCDLGVSYARRYNMPPMMEGSLQALKRVNTEARPLEASVRAYLVYSTLGSLINGEPAVAPVSNSATCPGNTITVHAEFGGLASTSFTGPSQYYQ
ncbi:hypothetical protein SODALDRAFT_362249 [Sodiomyces alkalinus F11]|uniref:Uncharacterized protein n=1 Tax=Sodiomyces alkalinus (strain CBS 110278 / VKM F-3762 / F11) TaxID=1314773 RepID=A0A3N2PPS6_SODAK|nr:hypothetical protein SODALDRAFT_362249 [Sodiomyces alkalinus F11]ROT36440.1 hypothetical protein SODALDRAFT_362249 [Sodiomyces alkalinus F11]